MIKKYWKLQEAVEAALEEPAAQILAPDFALLNFNII